MSERGEHGDPNSLKIEEFAASIKENGVVGFGDERDNRSGGVDWFGLDHEERVKLKALLGDRVPDVTQKTE